jgi:hypothetical protein
VRKQRQPPWAPTYRALSDALGKCLPLPEVVDVRLDLYEWQRLRSELGQFVNGRWRRLPFDQCPILLDLWGSRIHVWPALVAHPTAP